MNSYSDYDDCIDAYDMYGPLYNIDKNTPYVWATLPAEAPPPGMEWVVRVKYKNGKVVEPDRQGTLWEE